jgi:hypothetical protein
VLTLESVDKPSAHQASGTTYVGLLNRPAVPGDNLNVWPGIGSHLLVFARVCLACPGQLFDLGEHSPSRHSPVEVDIPVLTGELR